MSFDVSEFLLPSGILHWEPRIHTVNSSPVFSLFACVLRWTYSGNLLEDHLWWFYFSHLGLYDILCWLVDAPLLKSRQLKMCFPLTFSLPDIPTLLLFCHAEEPALRHKSHHMHKTRWRGLVFVSMQQLVFILRSFSFVDAEILLLSWNIGSTSITCVK